MKNYYVRKILDENNLKLIKDLIKDSNEKQLWTDGHMSAVGDYKKSQKINFEMVDCLELRRIHEIIMNSLDCDIKFKNFTAAKSTNLNIVSKTPPGGFYQPHIDNWNNGDYSTTVFLNDPDEYVGGELCLYIDGEEETKIKLDAGWGITYSTGTIHRVNKVIAGTRYVSVFWTQSLLQDPFIRHIYGELGNVLNNMILDYSVHLNNCKSAYDDPVFKLDALRSEMLRRYSK